MAVPPKTDEAFLREVDEELRRDRLTSFWTRYGRLLIGAIVLGLAVFAGVLYWRYHRAEAAGAEGEQAVAAMQQLQENPTSDVSTSLQALAASDGEAYRATAKLTQADLLEQKGDLKGAGAKFAEIARDTTFAQPFRDLALVRQTGMEFDTLQPQAVVDRLRSLAVKGNPWFGSAGEMVAISYVRMNRRDLAGRMFGDVARDDKVPASIRQRAVEMAGVLGVDAVDQPGEKKAS